MFGTVDPDVGIEQADFCASQVSVQRVWVPTPYLFADGSMLPEDF